jgi:hypothetical protein
VWLTARANRHRVRALGKRAPDPYAVSDRRRPLLGDHVELRLGEPAVGTDVVGGDAVAMRLAHQQRRGVGADGHAVGKEEIVTDLAH